MTPHRVQLRRTKGWRMPENTVSVARPTKWGNPYYVLAAMADPLYVPTDMRAVATRGEAVMRFEWLFTAPTTPDPYYPHPDDIREALRGKNLACWCPLDAPCHADVLLEVANS